MAKRLTAEQLLRAYYQVQRDIVHAEIPYARAVSRCRAWYAKALASHAKDSVAAKREFPHYLLLRFAAAVEYQKHMAIERFFS